jgi:hypothetical protein
MGNSNSNSNKITFGSVNPMNDVPPRPGYYLRANSIKYQGTPIQLLPGESNFQKLNFGYLKTNMRVFYNGIPIPFANPKTFTTVSRKELRTTPFAKLNAVLGKDIVNNKIRWYQFGKKIYEE